MVWLYPAAVASLLALVGPVAVHMLRRQQARRIIVPSVRFVPSLDDSAVRFKRLSDPLLLLVRSAVIACAALALAQPLILSEGRMNAWSARTARVVVVDRSQSARGAVSSEAIAAEASSADPSATVETAELGSGLDQASAWLAVAPPAMVWLAGWLVKEGAQPCTTWTVAVLLSTMRPQVFVTLTQ